MTLYFGAAEVEAAVLLEALALAEVGVVSPSPLEVGVGSLQEKSMPAVRRLTRRIFFFIITLSRVWKFVQTKLTR